ncbi:hypothetical protein [Vibrio sp. CB1-14]|uniref:Uncharacterized protein n=1 Tax=Vibrio chaetopteri TaxID=3016528 RepID=A0AAU8BP53_9VIBR
MERTIYLNDRPYRICDIGEGECSIVVFYSDRTSDLYERYKRQYSASSRVILVDTSESWDVPVESMTLSELDVLVEDIHLLADIYWLDQFSIVIERATNNIYEKFKSGIPERLKLLG